MNLWDWFVSTEITDQKFVTIFHFFVYIKTLLGLQSLLQRIGTSLKNIVLKNSYMLKFRKKSVLQFFSVSPFLKKTIVLSWERKYLVNTYMWNTKKQQYLLIKTCNWKIILLSQSIGCYKGELPAVIVRLMSKCLWSRWIWQ